MNEHNPTNPNRGDRGAVPVPVDAVPGLGAAVGDRPVPLTPGVIVTPAEQIPTVISSKVSQFLSVLGPNQNGALLTITTKTAKGTSSNLALVTRTPIGLDVAAWIGKTWGTDDGEVGVATRFTW